MIEIYANKLDNTPTEKHIITQCVCVQDWIDKQAGYDRRVVPLWSVYVNDQRLLPYQKKRITPSCKVKIVVEPKADPVTWIAIIVALGSAAYAYSMTRNLGENAIAQAAGKSIYDASAKANLARLNSLIRESFGTMPVYPDYLTPPRQFYVNNTQRIEMLLCVGVGHYQLEKLLLSETNVGRYAGEIAYQLLPPGADLTNVPGHEIWYTSKEVSNLKLTQTPGEMLEDWSGDFSGTEITVYYAASPAACPFAVGEVFQQQSGLNQGMFEVLSVSGASNEVMNCRKVVQHATYNNGWEYTYVADSSWSAFTAGTGEPLNWNSVTSGEEWFGPYAAQPDGQSISGIEYDVVFRRGLGKYNDDGELEPHTVEIETQWRLLGDDAWASSRTSYTDATPDELGFTKYIPIITPTIDLTGATASRTAFKFGVPYRAYISAQSAGDFKKINTGDTVTIYGVHENLNGAYSVYLAHDDYLYLVLPGGSGVSSAWDSYGAIAAGTLRADSLSAEVRFRRITPDSTTTEYIDIVEIERLKARLESKKSYADITTLSFQMVGSSSIADSAKDKINGVFTRKLPVWDGTTFSGLEATNDIAPVVAYLMKNAGYSYSDIDMQKLGELHAIWQDRGDTYSREHVESMTLLDVMREVLALGYTEPVMDQGPITFVREAASFNWNNFYGPNQIKGGVSRAGKFIEENDDAGVEIEYFDIETRASATVMCTYGNQSALNAKKIRLLGCTNIGAAWRYGRRLARRAHFKPETIKYKTEYEAFNSAYGTHDAVCDNLTGGAVHGCVTAVDGTTVTVDKPCVFGEGVHYLGISRPDGSVFGPVIVTAGTTDYELIPVNPLDFTPVFDGSLDAPSFSFGSPETWALHTITRTVSDQGDSVAVVAEEYIAEIYADDDNEPPAELLAA